MTASTETRGTDRGAESGPPVAVDAIPRELPRLGPLPEPGLLDRLRASWALADLVPAFDPRGFTRREWRRAAIAAVVVHAVALTGALVGSYYGVWKPAEPAPREITMLGPNDFRNAPDPTAPTTDGSSGGDDAAAGSPDGGGGSNTGPTPVTQGTPPPSSPAPIVAPRIAPPPLIAPALPVTPTVQGPLVDVPPPVSPGLPDAPPAPGAPSLGDQGGAGVGNSPGGPGAGNSAGPGRGNNGDGPGGNGRDGGPGRTGPGSGTEGPAGNGPDGPGGPPVANRSIRFAYKARPVATPAMIEANTTGSVTFEVTVGPNGALLSARPIQTLANGGTQAALEALRKCRFLPAIRNGQYVTETTVVRFEVRSN